MQGLGNICNKLLQLLWNCQKMSIELWQSWRRQYMQYTLYTATIYALLIPFTCSTLKRWLKNSRSLVHGASLLSNVIWYTIALDMKNFTWAQMKVFLSLSVMCWDLGCSVPYFALYPSTRWEVKRRQNQLRTWAWTVFLEEKREIKIRPSGRFCL